MQNDGDFVDVILLYMKLVADVSTKDGADGLFRSFSVTFATYNFFRRCT